MGRVELARRAAHAADAVGDHRRAAGLVELALAQVDPVAEPIRAGLLHERRGWYLTALGDNEAAFAAYRQAVRLVPATPPSVERARVLATYGRALMIALRHDEAFAVCEEALAMARQQGAEREAGVALTVLGTIQAERGNPEVGIPALREGLSILERLVDPENLDSAYLNLGYALWLAGRIEEGHEVTLAGYETMRRLGRERQAGGHLLINAGSGLIELGRWDEADELLRRALELSPPEGWARARVHCELAELAIVRGRLDAAEEQLNRARPFAAQGTVQAVVEYRYALAELRAWQGRLEEARTALAEALDLLATANETLVEGRPICLGLRIEADRAERGRARRDPGEVAYVRRAAKALLARGSPGGRRLWPVHEAAAWAATRDAEFSRAEGHSDPGLWEAAANAWRDLPQPYRAAYAGWRQTEALLAGNHDPSQLATVVRAAHDLALRLGAELLCRELEALAARARISLQQPRQAPTPEITPLIQRLGLTPRELEVLGYLAAGRSNREIGQALFISAKTASVHVSNILRKLDVTNRVEAAGVAHKLGLTQESSH
jgi:ATP/maltotriose-dependent transcriptional regulator MalT